MGNHPSSAYPHSARAEVVRVAFLARVSTDDQQDPTLSLPRQLANCEAALAEGWRITAWFWDIESGRMALERRGRGHAHEHIEVPLPRDGGLAEAEHPRRRFDAVICESIDRLARRTYIGTRIENDLEQVGVRLYAADEPIDPRGKRSTSLLTRRVKQGVAEWYVTDMLERSWDGLKVHTGQGWNVGKPPYGYAAAKVEHPVPAKAADSLTKTRLTPDSQQAPVVAYIFKLRVAEQLGYDAIAARLNGDPIQYPVPEPTNPRRRRGVWSGSAVREIVRNPKYTGYMVWNRRATKAGGKVNHPSAWVWSDQPTHEPLVDRRTFEAAAQVTRVRRGSRAGSGPNPHPATQRGYLLRSYVRCGDCDQRMFGTVRKGRTYYRCCPANNNGDRLDRYPDHPPTVYVREEPVVEALDQIIATYVFGADRHAYLGRALAGRPTQQHQDAASRRVDILRAQLEDVATRQDRLIEELETTDATDRSFRDRLRRRFDALEAERERKAAQLQDLEHARRDGPDQAVDLLDALPILRELTITAAPEAIQRKLYDALQLEIHYDRPDHARFRIVLYDDTVDAVAAAVSFTHAAAAGATDGVAGRTPPGARNRHATSGPLRDRRA